MEIKRNSMRFFFLNKKTIEPGHRDNLYLYYQKTH